MDSSGEMVDTPVTKLRLRSYQQEMLELSLEKNIIVAMDTGSGKTHIAIARILAELERNDKLVWFLSPSVALSMQQAEVLQSNLPAYHVRPLTGLDGVDKWTDQRLWNAILANVHVAVGTPAVLLDALTHGFVTLNQIGLCIFDEAHRTTKSHPMNSIMKLFYHPAREQGGPIPHILGLTASPVTNSKQKSLETIEANLNALAVTPKRNREELESHVNAPKFSTILYSKRGGEDAQGADSVCKRLETAARNYDFSKDPYLVDLIEQDDPVSQKELAKVMTKRKTYCWENLRALDLRACTMQEQLGTSMTRWYVNGCINKFREDMTSETTIMPDLSEKERKHLSGIFDTICSRDTDDAVDCPIVSEKVRQLLKVLKQHDPKTTRGIVFVEQRVQVTALAQLLARFPDLSHRVATFVGTSASTKRKISVADLVDVKEQEKDLSAFRRGEKNLMIATNVLEEGIDVSACNLVICFDPPKNLVSFVQRRGRARQKDSHYYLFVPDDQPHDKQWAKLEAEMKKAYMDDTRQLAPRSDEDLALSDKIYHIPSTGALLTLENAKAHLYHFCSVSTQASSYVDLRPEFDTEEHPGFTPNTSLWSSSVYLPASVDPAVRFATSSTLWSSEGLAIADAAFEAYVVLHKANLVNDNLLPLIKDYGPDVGQQHLDQPSIVQVAGRTLPLKKMHEAISAGKQQWQPHQVAVCLRGDPLCEMKLWMPSKALSALSVELFWNEHDVYTTTIDSVEAAAESVGLDTLPLLQSCTRMLFSSAHGNRISANAWDFPVLLAPSSEIDLQQWLRSASGVKYAMDGSQSCRNLLDVGLVRVKGQVGRAYIFQAFDLEAESTDDQGFVVTNFPKRKDFLHEIPECNTPAAYSSKQYLKAAECTIDNLPVRYAVFAALVPSIIHRIETFLLAVDLQSCLLQQVNISDLELILEAISAPSANETADYNRLEFLGDTILKHCTELQVMAQHVHWPESYLTLERDRIVRNSNLAKAAISAGLDKYILTKPFTGNKWRPTYVSELLTTEPEPREMSSKTLADVVEALIGAAYVDGGLQKGLTCMSTLLPTETWHAPEQCFDMLIHELRPTKTTNLDLLERLIGHKFQHLTLLVEAITHISYPYNRTGLSYERLEFLGDSVLDIIITPKLFAHPRKLKHWELHRIHEALVNSHFLGFCCMAYSIDEEKFDIIQDGPSEQQQIQQSTRKIHLHDFLKLSSQLTPLRQKSIDLFTNLHPTISESLRADNEYPWPDLVALSPPKFFCDLVESILGALYIDTRGELSVCEAFVEKLGVLEHMRRILDERVECFSPKERLGAVADREEVKYVNWRGEDESGGRVFGCTVKVGEEEVVKVEGCRHKDEAEVKAAYQACKVLEARGGLREGRKRKFDVAAVDEADEGAMDVDSPDDGNV